MSKQNDDKGKGPESGAPAAGGSLKEVAQKRRQVFKPILDNPFTQSDQWPEPQQQDAGDIEQLLCQYLTPLGKYNGLVEEMKQKKQQKKTYVSPTPPPLHSQVTVGFNSTVKRLENQASVHRHRLRDNKKRIRLSNQKQEDNNRTKSDEKQDTSKRTKSDEKRENGYIKYVFVAKADIRPQLLIQSFPILTFTASRSLEDRVKLIPLPKGAMTRLSNSIGLPNTSIVGLTKGVKEFKSLYDMVDRKIVDVDIPWLQSLFLDPEKLEPLFHKPPLKVLSTSAPVLSKRDSQRKSKH